MKYTGEYGTDKEALESVYKELSEKSGLNKFVEDTELKINKSRNHIVGTILEGVLTIEFGRDGSVLSFGGERRDLYKFVCNTEQFFLLVDKIRNLFKLGVEHFTFVSPKIRTYELWSELYKNLSKSYPEIIFNVESDSFHIPSLQYAAVHISESLSNSRKEIISSVDDFAVTIKGGINKLLAACYDGSLNKLIDKHFLNFMFEEKVKEHSLLSILERHTLSIYSLVDEDVHRDTLRNRLESEYKKELEYIAASTCMYRFYDLELETVDGYFKFEENYFYLSLINGKLYSKKSEKDLLRLIKEERKIYVKRSDSKSARKLNLDL